MSADELPLNEIREFCDRWQVSEFALFGSFLRDDFGPDSDVDILVRFDESANWGLLAMTQMVEELEATFGRRVDLLTRRGVESGRNARRREAILNSAQVIDVA
jgi:uncharacterized protein